MRRWRTRRIIQAAIERQGRRVEVCGRVGILFHSDGPIVRSIQDDCLARMRRYNHSVDLLRARAAR